MAVRLSPFHGSPFEIAMQHLSLPPSPLLERLPELSSGIEEVVLRALAKEPGQRFASVQDFAIALQQAAQRTTSLPATLLSGIAPRAKSTGLFPTPPEAVVQEQFAGRKIAQAWQEPTR